jgi:DNA repair ATPase RecN
VETPYGHKAIGRTIVFGDWPASDARVQEQANMEFIAASREAIPELCAYIRELEAKCVGDGAKPKLQAISDEVRRLVNESSLEERLAHANERIAELESLIRDWRACCAQACGGSDECVRRAEEAGK